MEVEIDQKNEELVEFNDLRINCQKSKQKEWETKQMNYKRKIKQLDEALKTKSRQLIEYINRDRGEKTKGSNRFVLNFE